MSDSEASDFRFDDGSDSDDYVQPAKGKKAAPAKKAAAPKANKAAPKKAAATKKVPLSSKKNLPNGSAGSDSEASGSSSPVKRKVEDDDDFPVQPATKKTASEMYQKLSQLEHILKRPDTYIGSIEAHTQEMWVVDPETKQMVNRTITYVPGFFKIFDEILVNAADNKINDPTMQNIKITIDRTKNQISVHNDGKGIPVEMHSKEHIMIPELIFGHLLTSSNYDDDQKKLTGGRNGYGAKLTNIYSTEFIVETADKVNGKIYKQVFSNNMSKKAAPKITENKKGEEWTKITFTPDLQRFGMTTIDDDTYALLMKRVYDMAGTVKDIKVFLDKERLKIKDFQAYCQMYLAASTPSPVESLDAPSAAAAKPKVYYERISSRWEVGFALSDGDSFQQVSFANSIATIKGGTHVDLIATQLTNKLVETIKKKGGKGTNVKPGQIKSQMWIFVNALIENPSFDSQTKETLTLKSSAFGSRPVLSDDFVKKVAKSGIVDNVLAVARFKQDQELKKTDGAKRTRIGGITKLEDANWAGGRKASRCTLILTEGDSAKTLAISGIGAIAARDEFGVFPLRGKLLNVREASHDQILKNVEIQNIKQILGLKHNQEYKSTDTLRYGHLMIMTDQDHDGSHIKGLIINFLDHFYPSLLRIPNFLVEFITPIVKVSKGKTVHTFYTIPQYEEWKENNNDGRGWTAKYYKGLGTSDAKDAATYFSEIDKHRLAFEALSTEDRPLIDMAFNKQKADDRKEWLRLFKPNTFLDHEIKTIAIKDFVNKELILFSMADNIRSIPSVADGLKPGQRKVLYACFKRNLVKEVKVAQLGGYVAENTAYHHGEQSLTSTIVGLAQNFVGSNNVNILRPNGQFGTRIMGGKDAASARYIFTELSSITRTIFNKSDDAILNYLVEEGQSIEPEYYLPTVPMVLVNGADGIGTGWSTSIPNYNPRDIVDNLRRLMNGEELEKMTPWFRGFNGTIERIDADKYKVSGTATKIDDKTIEITELPVRKWTQDFKDMLEEMTSGAKKGKDGKDGKAGAVPIAIKDYEEHHTDTTVHFKLHMKEDGMKRAEAEGFDKYFKLSSTLATSNMVCFDLNGKIKKYSSPEQILQDFYPKRLEYYGLRKQHCADELNKEFERLSNQARFVMMIIDKELNVSNKKKAALVAELRELKFRPFPKGAKRPESESTAALEDEDEEDTSSDSDYDYLLGMAIWNLTAEKVAKLLALRDDKEQELLALLKLRPEDLWNQDLDKFLEDWESVLEGDIALARGIKSSAKKGAVRKRAKAGSDSEDDFKPTKAKRAPAKPRAKPAPSAAASAITSAITSTVASTANSPVKRSLSDSEEELPPPKKPAPRARAKPVTVDIDDSDDDMYIKPSTAAKAEPDAVDSDDEVLKAPSKPPSKAKTPAKPKAAPKAAAKKAVKADSDGESEAEAAPKKRATKAAPKKPAAKSKAKDNTDFEEDDDDFDAPAPPPRATTARAARGAAKKPIYVDLSESESD